ncbi:ras guanine nucleotide exchange factor domain-containing protein [Mycena capillaripes]|nr:ras guanine nucleotide exchange factor domain-containing protein [Mycena capillaripes]
MPPSRPESSGESFGQTVDCLSPGASDDEGPHSSSEALNSSSNCYHPSAPIHESLLDCAIGATVAVAHDDEWASPLSELDSRIACHRGFHYTPQRFLSEEEPDYDLVASGEEYLGAASSKTPKPELPWYLQPKYNPSEIAIDPDGSVLAGTVTALVERLTAHEESDRTFIKSFLMTFKSFITVGDLFDLLVQRFWIQPPPKLTQAEHEEWANLKQHVIRVRVLNIFKSMVVDDDVLEKEDLFILDRMKEFITTDEVARFPIAKLLSILIERVAGVPPPPLVPNSSETLKLLDIEPLELARQLTLMENQLNQRIRPMECLRRAREQRTENIDNITVVIQTSNKIALWVQESVLSQEDSRGRAGVVKHLISVADRCRTMNNFSTMAAIIAGLNTPPIHRLKRTWEQVNSTYMAQFGACETIIDSNKSFTPYRSIMTSVIPPCVPFLGVYLSTLQFIQDFYPDHLPAPGANEGAGSTLVNFRKRQKASEVINDIKRWQAPFNFHSIPDTKESSERFWTISLEREPRERDDQKMTRLLQEAGFL